MGRFGKKHITAGHFSKSKDNAHDEGNSMESESVSADEEALAAWAKKIQRKKAAKKEKEREESVKRNLPVS